MKQRAAIRVEFIGDRPRILVREPYYAPIEIATTAAGALGAFASIIGGMAVIVGNGMIGPLLGTAIVCIFVFTISELMMVRAAPVKGRLNAPDSDFSAKVCRITRHDYQPQGVTTEDRLGITPRPQPPRMVWRCTRCGDEQWLPPGTSPESTTPP